MKLRSEATWVPITRFGLKIGPTVAMAGMVNGVSGICGKGILKLWTCADLVTALSSSI